MEYAQSMSTFSSENWQQTTKTTSLLSMMWWIVVSSRSINVQHIYIKVTSFFVPNTLWRIRPRVSRIDSELGFFTVMLEPRSKWNLKSGQRDPHWKLTVVPGQKISTGFRFMRSGGDLWDSYLKFIALYRWKVSK